MAPGKDSGKTAKILVWSLVALILVAAVVAVIVWIFAAGGNGNQDGENIAKITVIKSPDKMEYRVGEDPVYDGIWIQVLKNNGSTTVIKDASLLTFTGWDSSKAMDMKTITVTYEGYSDTFHVKIVEPLNPIPTLESIELEGDFKTEYKLGDSLSVKGGVVVRKYSDGSYQKVNLMKKDVFGFKDAMQQGVGQYELTVQYEKDGVLVETKYSITISE